MTQKLIIRFENNFPGKHTASESSYEVEDIITDELFWLWFVSVWTTLGIPSITAELEKDSALPLD